MQASQTLAVTVDMYFFDAGRSVPKTKSTVAKNEKQNPRVFLAKSSICNVISISTNTPCPRPLETEKPGQHLPARVRAKTESDFHSWPKPGGPEAGAKKCGLTARYPTLCWRLGTRAWACLFLSPGIGYCQVCSSPLTKGEKSRQELA